jgi:hypothetical protein
MPTNFSDYIAFRNPLSMPVHFLALEIVVYVCFALTLRHAINKHREGDTYHLFQWVALFIYGLIMELVSFNFFQNYGHATFSVQFYYGQLPLYVTCIYLVFHYTGIKMVERLGLPRLTEGLLCGLAIVLIDVPFDSLGVDSGWWWWADNQETALHPRFVEAVETRWFGVPVTSYLWYLMYGALAVIFSRTAYAKISDWSTKAKLAIAPLVSVAVVVAGALAFEAVFWAPRNLGLSDHIIVATYFAAMLILALSVRAPNAKPAPAWLVSIPIMFHGMHLGLMAVLWSRGDLTSASGKLPLLIGAAIVSVSIVLILPIRDRLFRPHLQPSGQ